MRFAALLLILLLAGCGTGRRAEPAPEEAPSTPAGGAEPPAATGPEAPDPPAARWIVLRDGRRLPVLSWRLAGGRVLGVRADGSPLSLPSEELDLGATLRAASGREAARALPAPPRREPRPRGLSILGDESGDPLPARTPVPEDPPLDEAYWRGLADAARARIARGEEEIPRLERALSTARRDVVNLSLEVAARGGAIEVSLWHPELQEALIAAHDEAEQAARRLGEARADAESARRELEVELPEAARRAGALPGWLRPLPTGARE